MKNIYFDETLTETHPKPVADPGGGQFGATPPPNGCGVFLKWRPSDKNAPLFGAYRSKNKDKKY